MTLKQHIHELVDGLPDDSPLLVEVRETLRMNQALREAVADVEANRTFALAEFMTRVQERWPRQT
jgi:hypothetical protein